MEKIALLQIYSFFWYSLLIFFMPGSISYRMFVFIVAVSCAFSMLWIMVRRRSITKTTLGIIAIMLIVAVFYYITGQKYGKSDFYTSYMLVLIAQSIPAIIFGSMMATEDNFARKLKHWIPLIALIFTALVFYSALNPVYYSTSGGIMTNYGLNYQNMAYLAAYASNLCLYTVLFDDRYKYVSRYKAVRILYVFLIFANLFAILSAGGRGGIIDFVIINGVLVIIKIKDGTISLKGALKYILIGVATIFLTYYIIRIVAISTTGASGYNRILEFFRRGASSGRDRIYVQAFEKFQEAPIFGHGIGSIYYQIGRYSHNIILDALVETGIIGTLFIVIHITKCVIWGWRLHKNNKDEIIWTIFLLQGLGMAMFSGYYLAQIPIFWSMGYISTKYKMKHEETK